MEEKELRHGGHFTDSTHVNVLPMIKINRPMQCTPSERRFQWYPEKERERETCRVVSLVAVCGTVVGAGQRKR